MALEKPQAQPSDNDQALSCLVAAGMLNQPISLPGMPGNSITLTRMEPGPWFTALQRYPSLADQCIGLIFHSAEFNEVIVMGFFDVLAWCPAQHIWPTVYTARSSSSSTGPSGQWQAPEGIEAGNGCGP